jgi:hypothetical protein
MRKGIGEGSGATKRFTGEVLESLKQMGYFYESDLLASWASGAAGVEVFV